MESDLDFIKVRMPDGSVSKCLMGYAILDQEHREEGERLVFYGRSRYFDGSGKLKLTTPWSAMSAITNWKTPAPAPKGLFTRMVEWLHGLQQKRLNDRQTQDRRA